MKSLMFAFKLWVIKKLGGIYPVYRCDLSCEFQTINYATENDIKNSLSELVDKLYNENCFRISSSYDYISDKYIVKIELTAIRDMR